MTNIGLPWWLKGKESACQCLRSPGEGNGNSLQYFCLGNPMDRRAGQGVGGWGGGYSPWGSKELDFLVTKQQ